MPPGGRLSEQRQDLSQFGEVQGSGPLNPHQSHVRGGSDLRGKMYGFQIGNSPVGCRVGDRQGKRARAHLWGAQDSRGVCRHGHRKRRRRREKTFHSGSREESRAAVERSQVCESRRPP